MCLTPLLFSLRRHWKHCILFPAHVTGMENHWFYINGPAFPPIRAFSLHFIHQLVLLAPIIPCAGNERAHCLPFGLSVVFFLACYGVQFLYVCLFCSFFCLFVCLFNSGKWTVRSPNQTLQQTRPYELCVRPSWVSSRYPGHCCGQGVFFLQTNSSNHTEGKSLQFGRVCFAALLGFDFSPRIIKTREEEDEGGKGIKLHQPSLFREVNVNSEKKQIEA